MPPVPKPQHNRRIAKQKNRNQFSADTIQEIFERDEYSCVRCGSMRIDSIPHHVQYRSDLGEGTKRNGITICRTCHDYFHNSKKKHNVWAEEWVRLNLDEQGNRKYPVPLTPFLNGPASP